VGQEWRGRGAKLGALDVGDWVDEGQAYGLWVVELGSCCSKVWWAVEDVANVHACTHRQTDTHTYRHTHIHKHTHIHTHMHTHTRMHAHTHARTHAAGELLVAHSHALDVLVLALSVDLLTDDDVHVHLLQLRELLGDEVYAVADRVGGWQRLGGPEPRGSAGHCVSALLDPRMMVQWSFAVLFTPHIPAACNMVTRLCTHPPCAHFACTLPAGGACAWIQAAPLAALPHALRGAARPPPLAAGRQQGAG